MLHSNPLDFETTIRFVELIRLVKPALRWHQKEFELEPPANLPQEFNMFFSAGFALKDTTCDTAWQALRNAAWARDLDATEQLSLRLKYVHLFLEYGLPLGIGNIILNH